MNQVVFVIFHEGNLNNQFINFIDVSLSYLLISFQNQLEYTFLLKMGNKQTVLSDEILEHYVVSKWISNDDLQIKLLYQLDFVPRRYIL